MDAAKADRTRDSARLEAAPERPHLRRSSARKGRLIYCSWGPSLNIRRLAARLSTRTVRGDGPDSCDNSVAKLRHVPFGSGRPTACHRGSHLSQGLPARTPPSTLAVLSGNRTAPPGPVTADLTRDSAQSEEPPRRLRQPRARERRPTYSWGPYLNTAARRREAASPTCSGDGTGSCDSSVTKPRHVPIGAGHLAALYNRRPPPPGRQRPRCHLVVRSAAAVATRPAPRRHCSRPRRAGHQPARASCCRLPPSPLPAPSSRPHIYQYMGRRRWQHLAARGRGGDDTPGLGHHRFADRRKHPRLTSGSDETRGSHARFASRHAERHMTVLIIRARTRVQHRQIADRALPGRKAPLCTASGRR